MLQENQEWLKVIGKRQLVFCLVYVNLVAKSQALSNTKKNAGTLLRSLKEVGLKIKAHILSSSIPISCHQNAGRNYNTEIPSKNFENVAKIQARATAAANQSYAFTKVTFDKSLSLFSWGSSHALHLTISRIRRVVFTDCRE
jgi:hypothetical protein